MDIIEAFATKNRCYQVGARADHRPYHAAVELFSRLCEMYSLDPLVEYQRRPLM